MIYSKSKLEEIKNRSSLADIASEVTDLKPSGANLVGLSPFQTEKTPSFYIYDGGLRYKCFSSGKSGSIFDFVMETRGMSFPETVQFLAQRAGVALDGESDRSNQQAQKSKDLTTIFEIVANEYKEVLANNQQAKNYLKDRGISQELVQNFSIGFAPDNWNFIFDRSFEKVKSVLKIDSKKVNELFLQAGLIKKREESGFYDAFRARLIFPIRAKDGKFIALGGRILESSNNAPKYLNSSESLVYEKRTVLYGLYEALDAIRKTKHAFIVEGYFDVLSMVQKGFADVVASCGTAFGHEHATQISKLVNKVTVIFDADSAGKKAAARCFESFINTGIECFAVLLPAGEDPDSLCRNNSKSKVEQYFNNHNVLLFDFYILSVVEELGSPVSDLDQVKSIEPAKKGEVAKRILKTLTKIINPVERESFINRLSDLLEVKLSSVRELFHSETIVQQKNSRFAKEESLVKAEKEQISEKINQSLELYLKQLIVSVLCQPSIISTIISSTSFFDRGLISERQATLLNSMLNELREKGFAGLSLEDESTTRMQHNMAVASLEKYNFTPKNFISEAYRQMQLGGAAPDTLANEIHTVTERYSLKSELEVIRQKENVEQDLSNLEKLAQEKLMKKRMLKGKVLN